jgi:type VI secretion system secreted protein Hcp
MKRASFKGFLTAAMIATGLSASTNALAAVDMFIKIGEIKGESTDARHKGEIDVLAWSWGESRGTAQTRRGLLPRACIQDLSFTKYIDAASPQLIINGISGEIVPTAVLTVRRAGDTPFDFLKMTMRNVIVSSYSTGGSGGEDRLTENVVLHFDSLEGQYQKQNDKGGAEGEPIVWLVSDSSRGCR